VLEAELARGGMGAVYRARRSQDGGVVALKLLTAGPGATPEQLLRFQREGELAARLDHPGIVRVHGAGTVSWLSYLVMDLIDGEPLGAHAGRLAPLEVARLVAQVARAIEHAHAHGVVHRDLKPSNVLVRKDDGRAVVADFGIARDLESAAMTKSGALMGTPSYLSPEQATGQKATPASDVHALGALLFELLTGVPPFRQDDLSSLLGAIANERPAAPSTLARGVPRALDQACLDALAKAPAARPGAGELAARLEAIVARGGEDGAPARRRLSWLAAAAVVALVGVALLAGAPASDQQPRAPATGVTTRRTTTRPPPKAEEPPFVEPPWLRAIAARGDSESLLRALDAVGDGASVDPRARARALLVLADLDARWSPPDPARADAGAQLDHLLWMHWLWHRLDPAHRLPPARLQAVEGNSGWAMSQQRDATYLPRVASALTQVAPDWPSGYLLYATNTNMLPWSARDGALLRRGVEVAAAGANRATWGTLAMAYLMWLHQKQAEGDPAQAQAARAEQLELARAAATAQGELEPTVAVTLLLRGSDLAEPDEADALLARAEALTGPSASICMARAVLLARTGRSDAAALAEAERGFDLLARPASVATPAEVARCAALVAQLSSRAGQRERALAALARGFELSGPGVQHPGLAMRRVQLVAEGRGSRDALEAALEGLVRRLAAELEEGRRADDRALREALAEARAAASDRPLTAERVAQRLGRWFTESAARQLDPP
jgi:serine/threonine-protein kinase